jgi:hypothetical protein
MRGTLGLAVALLVVAGCHFDPTGFGTGTTGSASNETTAASSMGASSSSSASGGGSESEASASATTTGQGSGESTAATGTTGPDVPVLVDDGLLARWYLDEAEMGQAPRTVIDHHPPGADLSLVYTSEWPSYDVYEDNRGLRWTEVGRNGRALVDIAGTELATELTDATEVTFELVLVVNEVMPEFSRFLHIGTANTGGDFAIGSTQIDRLVLRWQGNPIRELEVAFGEQRHVLHVVVDTPAADPVERLRAYLDGLPLVSTGRDAPAQGQGLPLLPSAALTLGNRSNGQRSFRGRLQYAAIYTEVLDAAQLATNVSVLLASDDPPR